MVSQSGANSKTLNILINSGTQARSNAMGGGDAGRADRQQAQADKKNFDSLRSGTKDMYDMFKKRVPPLNAIFKKMGIEVGVRSILKQSQIFTSTVGSIFQILGALVDVTLAPFLPVIVPAIKKLGKLIPWWAAKMNKWSKDITDNILKPTINAIRWIVNAWKKTLGKLPSWGQWILGIYMILLMRQGMGLMLKGLAKPSGAFGILKRVLPFMGKNSAKSLTQGQKILAITNKSGKNLSIMANLAKGGKKVLTLGGLITGSALGLGINKPGSDGKPSSDKPTPGETPEGKPKPGEKPPTRYNRFDDFMTTSSSVVKGTKVPAAVAAGTVANIPQVNKWTPHKGGSYFEDILDTSKSTGWKPSPLEELYKKTKPVSRGGANSGYVDDMMNFSQSSNASNISVKGVKPTKTNKVVEYIDEALEIGGGVSKLAKIGKAVGAVAGPAGIAFEAVDMYMDWQNNSAVLDKNRAAKEYAPDDYQGMNIMGKDMGVSNIPRVAAGGADAAGIIAPLVVAALIPTLPAVMAAAVAGLAVSEIGQIGHNVLTGQDWKDNTLMGMMMDDNKRATGDLTNPYTGQTFSGLEEFTQGPTGISSIVQNPQAATMGGWNQHDKYTAGILEGPIDRGAGNFNITLTINEGNESSTEVAHKGVLKKKINTPSYNLEIGDW